MMKGLPKALSTLLVFTKLTITLPLKEPRNPSLSHASCPHIAQPLLGHKTPN